MFLLVHPCSWRVGVPVGVLHAACEGPVIFAEEAWSLILEKVAYAPDKRMTLEEIATLLERKPHNLRPVLNEIVESDLLLEVDLEAYALPKDLADRLAIKLQVSGGHIRELEQRVRYALDRMLFNGLSPTDSC